MSDSHAAVLARGFLAHMSETSSASDALYRKILDADVWLPHEGPEPSVELILSVAKSATPEQLSALVRLVRSPESLDALARGRQSKQVWRAVSAHENLSLATAEYLAKRSSRPSVEDYETFENVANHPQIGIALLVDYVRENRNMSLGSLPRRLGRNAAKRPDQWSALLDVEAWDLGLVEAQASLIGHVDERSIQLELLGRIPAKFRESVVSFIFIDTSISRNAETLDLLWAKLLLESHPKTKLSEWVDKPMADGVVELLAGSDRKVAHRLLLLSAHTPDKLRAELVERIEKQTAPEGQASLALFPIPTIYDLADVARRGLLDEALALRTLRLFEKVDTNLWDGVRNSELARVNPSTGDTEAGLELLMYLAASVTKPKTYTYVHYISSLLDCGALPVDVLVAVMRCGEYQLTEKWFRAAFKRKDPDRVKVMAALVEDDGTAFGGGRVYSRSVFSRAEILGLYVPGLINENDTEMIEWLMTSCEGVLAMPNFAHQNFTGDWLAAACAEAGVLPEQGYEVLLSLLPDWEGTPRELVDTVAAVA
jgi:hypothetical protein